MTPGEVIDITVPDEDVGIPCGEPGCSEVFHGDRAAFNRGSHRYRVHKVSGKRKGAPSEEDHRRSPIGAAVRDFAADVDGKGVPTANALSKALGRAVGMSTMAVASYYVETDDTLPFDATGDAARNELVDELSLNPKAAEELMSPFGRALAPTSLNKKYGRAIVDNVDVVGAVSEVVLLAFRWKRAFRDRRIREVEQGLRREDPIEVVGTPVTPAPAGPPSPPMAQPTPAPPLGDQPLTSPAPQMGTVVTSAMVEDMRRRKGAGG